MTAVDRALTCVVADVLDLGVELVAAVGTAATDRLQRLLGAPESGRDLAAPPEATVPAGVPVPADVPVPALVPALSAVHLGTSGPARLMRAGTAGGSRGRRELVTR